MVGIGSVAVCCTFWGDYSIPALPGKKCVAWDSEYFSDRFYAVAQMRTKKSMLMIKFSSMFKLYAISTYFAKGFVAKP